MSEEKILKIGILKNGTIGSSLLLAFLIDERAEAIRLSVREVTSGAMMHPPEECIPYFFLLFRQPLFLLEHQI